MDRQSLKSGTTQAKRLLLATLVAASASGCASQRGVQVAKSSTEATLSTNTTSVATSDVDWEQVLSEPETGVIQPAGYNDGVVIASPAVFAQPPKEEGKRSFGAFLQLDPPEESEEKGVGSVEKEDAERNDDNRGSDADSEDDSKKDKTISSSLSAPH